MGTRRFSIVLVILAGAVFAACTSTRQATNSPTGTSNRIPTALPAEISTQASGVEVPADESLKNGTYVIDEKPITLVNGVAEIKAAPGSASKNVTRFFGDEVEVDLNADGLLDAAFLLQQETGGSGTFYYVVAAIKTGKGYLGTNAVFIGDRIAPQSLFVDPDKPSQVIVSYADRNANEPMSSPPTVGVSRTFRFEHGLLVEVAASAKPTP